MRKKLEKFISIVSILMFFVVSIGTTEVHASASAEWNIKIAQIGEVKRQYFNDRLSFLSENMQRPNGLVNAYNINTKEVAIQAECINQSGHIYVSVDDHYVGNAEENLIYYSGDISDSFTTFVVKNLTPGQHKIEVKADSPNYMSAEQKRDIIYVNMLPYEDEEIDKSIADIKNGTANLYDYEVVGVDVVNGTNLQVINNLIKGKDLNPSNVQNTIIQIVKQANDQTKLDAAFKRINSGSGTITDYTDIGVVNVTSSNLNAINAEVKSVRDSKQADLTKNEIQNIVDNLPSMINDANTRISAGTATLLDYTIVGVTGVTSINLPDVNDYVKGKDNSTLSKLQANVNTMVITLNAINNGTAGTTHYTTLGITTVTADNLATMNKSVTAAKTAKGNNLTKLEIVKVVQDTLVNIANANTKINAGTATLADYTLMGITGITTINLADVNDYVKGKDNSTLSKLQTNVNTMVITLNAINNGTAGTTHYTTLGITTVTADNLSIMNKSITAAKTAKGNNLTKSEIVQVVQDTLVNIANVSAKINVGTATLADYTLIGITGITDINLADVNDYVKGKDNSTLSKLQANVNTMVTTLNAINNGTAGTTHYTILGITTVTSDNITTMNKIMSAAKTTKGNNLTKSEIVKVVQDTLVNIANAYTKINAGTATLADYTLIGITEVTDMNLADVNDYVKGKDNSTKSKLQSNVVNISNALYYINQGSASTVYYTTLGITTVTADNITQVSKNMLTAKTAKGNNLTKAEIQKVVSDTLAGIASAYTRVNAGTATLADYTLIGITGVTDINLADVNDYVKGKDNTTKSKLQTNVANISNALNYINQGSASTTFYTTLGITTVTTDNITAVSKSMLTAKTAKGNNLTKAEIQKVVSDTLVVVASTYARVNAGTATLADYTLVGVTGVTSINLADVNNYVKGKDNSTLSKLQANVSKIVSTLNAINGAAGNINNYIDLGITTVTSDNFKVINQNVVNARVAKGSYLTKAEIVKVVQDTLGSIADANTRINAGAATLSDYTLVGVTGVTSINLVDVNNYVKGKDNSTLSKLQANVSKIASALNAINGAAGNINNYIDLGITTVTSDNFKVINQNVVNARVAKGSYLTKAEIVKVVQDTLKI